jgi:uncharacterized membrane protein (UPF0127 family)
MGLAAAMLALAGCARGAEPAAQAVAKGAEVKDVKVFFPLTVGEKALRVQVAVTLPEMQRGLMGRTDLGPDDGMVFVYPAPQQMSFWMRNTPTPLDIGFFTADGKLGEVYPLYPYDETPVESAGADYTLALEVNQGWFAKHGIKPGAKLNLGQLAEALRARGFEPRRYGVVAP